MTRKKSMDLSSYMVTRRFTNKNIYQSPEVPPHQPHISSASSKNAKTAKKAQKKAFHVGIANGRQGMPRARCDRPLRIAGLVKLHPGVWKWNGSWPRVAG